MKLLVAIMCIGVLFFCKRVEAQWPALPSPNVAVTSQAATTDAARYTAARDGVGGSYVVWEDDRNDPGGKTGIFCQRMQSFGVVKFAANGVQISDVAGSNQKRPWVTDGANSSALIVWEDERNSGTTSDDIYAKAIDSTGATLWGGANGIAVCNAADKQELPQIVSDGSGGGIIVWRDRRDNGTTNRDIYAQRINSAGTVQWAANGVAICNAVDQQTNFDVIADGSGGAIIVWEDDRSGTTTDIYAQKINSAGVVQWTANGEGICTNTADDQLDPKLISDGAGGAIITWVDLRDMATTNRDIYAQSINSAGTVQWAADGIVICNAADNQDIPAIESNGAGGAIITWEDDRTTAATSTDVYTQKVNSAGVVQWAANGISICTSTQRQRRVHSSPANNGAIIVVWEDRRNGKDDIYLEVIATDGTLLSGVVNGLQVCSNAETQARPYVFDNGSSEWIVVWEDDRNDPNGNNDIYAQGLNPTVIAALPNELLEFTAERQNKQVKLKWMVDSEINISEYVVERSTDGVIFEEVLTKKKKGNSGQHATYVEFDKNPLDGIVYYTLSGVSDNGVSKFSQMVVVSEIQAAGSDGDILIYPNPVTQGEFTVELLDFSSNDPIEIKVVDLCGKVVYREKVVNAVVSVKYDFPVGTYFVMVVSGEKHIMKKLVVSK